jgi:uncharacterized protein YukE
MNDLFDADVPRLRTGAERFAGLAEQAAAIAGELRRSLEATGEPWGTDAAGRAFAAVHEVAAGETLDRLAGVVDGLAEMGTTFDHAAAALRGGAGADPDVRG